MPETTPLRWGIMGTARINRMLIPPLRVSPDNRLVEFIELDGHPFWIGTQAHPEFKSRPNRPAPLFREFARAALDRAEGRNPHLIQLDADPATSRL